MLGHLTRSVEKIRPIYAAVRSVPIPPKQVEEAEPQVVLPFVTISREAGTDARSLACQLVDALNLSEDSEHRWTCWDRELVEKVACEHRVPPAAVESLEESRHSWVGDFLSSLKFTDDQPQVDEVAVYERVADTIRRLAQAGRVVIVGRGGVFITRRMPGGIHVRLVAPFEHRVACLARELRMSQEATAAYVRHLDRNRQAFYKRYWPGESLSPETWAITLNTAELEPPTMVRIIQTLVLAKVSALKRKAG